MIQESNNIRIWKTIGLIFIAIGIFLIPFNSYEGPSIMGEYNRHPCTYFLLIGFFISCVYVFLKGRIFFPLRNIVFQFLLLFLAWCVLATLLNINNVVDYYFKRTTGTVRFIKQYASLLISAVFILMAYLNLFNGIEFKRLFVFIRRIFLWSFIVVSIYSIFEILIVFFGISAVTPILELFNYFPFTTVKLSINERISSVSFEPPELGTYLITIAGWMFSYILTEKGFKKYIPTVFILVLTFFSDSRSGLAIVLLQLFLFLILLYRQQIFRPYLYKIMLIALIPIIALFVFKGATITTYVYDKITSFSLDDSKHGGSNRSRLGIQYANMLVYQENPISGVGFGQSAFAAKKNFPAWATHDNWEFRLMYLNPNHKPFPSVYNMYVRLLSETGTVGLLIFIGFLGLLIGSCYKIFISSNDYNKDFRIFALVLLITFIGISINWFKTETFRIFGFWVAFAFFLLITGNKLRFFSKRRILNT